MINKTNTTITFILLLMHFPTVLLAQTLFRFTPYDASMGFVQKEVMNIVQDKYGQMWFGTWDGLYRFDGYRFTNFKARPGDGIHLESNRLEKICADGNNIWMRGYGGSISCYDITTEQILGMPLSGYVARQIYPLKGGGVYVVMVDDRVYYVTNKSGKILAHRVLDGSQKIIKMKDAGDGHTLVFTSKYVYHSRSDGKLDKLLGSSVAYHDCYISHRQRVFCGDKGQLLVVSKHGRKSVVLPTTAVLNCIIGIAGGGYLVATDSDGLFVLDSAFQVNAHFTVANSALNGNDIKAMKADTYGNIWFCTGNPGVMRYDSKRKQLFHMDMPGQLSHDPAMWRNAVQLVEDSNRSVWVSPSGNGLARYDEATQSLIPFYDPIRQKEWTAENTVVDLFLDRQGNLWYNGKYTGLEKVTSTIDLFSTLEMHATEASGMDVRGVFQDSKGKIWVGARNGVISVYSANRQYMGDLTSDGRIIAGSNQPVGHAYSFAEDRWGNIWVGTKFSGLYRLKPSGNGYDIINFRNTSSRYSLPHNDIFSVFIDHKDRLWIATYGKGIAYMDLRRSDFRFISEDNDLKGYPKEDFQRVRSITSDMKGYIWVATTSGLMSFRSSFSSPRQIKYNIYKRNPDDSQSLSYNDVLQVLFTKSGGMYVCTYGGGFCSVARHGDRLTFTPYTMNNGLRSDIVLSMQPDNEGNIWLGQESGLARFNENTRQLELLPAYMLDNEVSINEGQPLMAKDGLVLFPARGKGAIYFNPKRVRMNRFVPDIIFTRLTLGQAVVRPQQQGSVLQRSINNTDQLRLDHNQNSFQIEFAAIDYRAPENISYAYKLEGLDKGWNYVGHNNAAIYNNLAPGEYRLLVKSTNSDGVWMNNTRSMDIVVTPSFWQTGWAYLLYLLLISGVFISGTYFYVTLYKLKNKVRMEQQLSDLKMKFFTEISHEIRTPLTLISGTLQSILHSRSTDTTLRRQLTVVNENSNRLLRLMTQFLDVRKIESGSMRLQLQFTDMGQFLAQLASNFNNIAHEHNIHFSVEKPDTPVGLWMDVEKCDKIFFNLITNAFRFTPEGKAITIILCKAGGQVVVKVKDEGCGIKQDRLGSIFSLFHSDDEGSMGRQTGSGVGLTLTRELVELHGGTITVESEVGKGSVFIVRLPENNPGTCSNANYIAGDIELPTIVHDPIDITDIEERDTSVSEENGMPSILVVDDNAQMRDFIRLALRDTYNIYEAGNGEEALEMAQEKQPDFMITDYMMPVMDGMMLVKSLKSNVQTSHIPVIILSAKVDDNSKIMALDYGVDDYIEKPFSADVLRARICNIIRKREELQQSYREGYINNSNMRKRPDVNDADRMFMDHLSELLRDNLSDSGLQVDDVARIMGMSRSVYFKKLKTLTGLGPNEYLRNLRMHTAAELIDTGLYSISEIAVKVGIGDAHYFSRLFKQVFGVTPSAYRQREE